MNKQTIDELIKIRKYCPDLGLKIRTDNCDKPNQDYVDFGFFDVTVGSYGNNLVCALGFGSSTSNVRFAPNFQIKFNEIKEEACELSRTLYKKPRWISGGSCSLSVPPRVFKRLDCDEWRAMVFDPKNYDVYANPFNFRYTDMHRIARIFNSLTLRHDFNTVLD
jgi:hypothetical protein